MIAENPPSPPAPGTSGALTTIRAAAGLATFLALIPAWLLAGRSSALRGRIARRGWGVLLRGFGIRLEVCGSPHPRALYVANHISWTDIAILARLTGAGFVAKREVGHWPLIGPLARRWGCIMVDRDRRLAARDQAAQIAALLNAGAGLVIFPEGTTSDGAALLPFRSSLLAAAGEVAGRQVQPVGIAYRHVDGAALTPAERRRVAWLGEDALLPHALALAAGGGLVARVWFGAPVTLACRKAAAEHCRRAIGEWLAAEQQAEAQAATLNRAA